MYSNNLNGGENVYFYINNWNNDVLGYLHYGKISVLYVPVIPSGKDKLLFIIEHDNNWVGTMHKGIKVNGKSIERLFFNINFNIFINNFF